MCRSRPVSLALVGLFLSATACASSGTTSDEAIDSPTAKPDRYRVDYSAGCDPPPREGLVGRDQSDWCRFQVRYVDRDGIRWESAQQSWGHSFLANAGTLASVTLKRSGNNAGRLDVTIRIEGVRVAFDMLESAGADSTTLSAEVVP